MEVLLEPVSQGGRHLLGLLSSSDSNWRVRSSLPPPAHSTEPPAPRFLILITVVVSVAVLIGNMYLIVLYAHPEDRNQAWIPKLVVVLGLSLAFLSVLMLPLDVANRDACDQTKLLSACSYTLPMTELWTYVYVVMIVWVGFILPFTLFYYEADSEKGFLQRMLEAGQYWFVTMLAFGVFLGIGFGLFGEAVYDSRSLNSGFVRASSDLSGATGCVQQGEWGPSVGNTTCDGVSSSPPVVTWSIKVTFPVYCIALVTIVGWILFMVFAGVGLIALPVDMIKSYVYRPQTMITKTEYIRMAGDIGKKAKEVVDGLRASQTDVRRNGRSRKSRRAIAALTTELTQLEADELKLREVYPQGEDAELSWAVTVIGYFFNFAGGILSAGLSATWLLHILIYMFLSPPPSPLLNTMFVEMDKVFGLFGTAAFGLFCFYLVLATLKGNFKLGLNFLFFSVHPMSLGNTLMSRRVASDLRIPCAHSLTPVLHSFLFNTGIIMLCSISIIQFCSAARLKPHDRLPVVSPSMQQAFDEYANETSVSAIFGNQITNLKGIGYIFQARALILPCSRSPAPLSVSLLAAAAAAAAHPPSARPQKGIFVFVLFSIAGFTALVMPFINRYKPKPKKNFDESALPLLLSLMLFSPLLLCLALTRTSITAYE